jgi:hypothetical protein
MNMVRFGYMRLEWSMPPSRRHPFIVLLILLACLLPVGRAWAWGRVGHRVIGRFVEARLTPKTRAAIAALLEPGESLADCSTWADDHRKELPQASAWHYVDVPLDESRYDARFSGDVPEKGCIVDKIGEMLGAVKDQSKSISERRFALRFLVHLVEDLHMPLHVGDNRDKGGNTTQVRFFDEGSNMHRLWDSDMIEHGGGTEETWLAKLAEAAAIENGEEAARGSIEDWATESLLVARAAYQVPGSDRRIKSGQKLSDAYLETNLPVVRKQLFRAGIRLAKLLNETFDDDGK